jgi:hypothetical protein
LSLRGGNESERRGNLSCLEMKRKGVRFVYGDAVDRHGLSALAMTRVEFYYEGSEEIEVTCCHCEEGTKLATRQSMVS